jgi:2-polyprenyl-3-methyl-5-hydroxy-6-metoxy-1,4-benzoquinol methylase
MPKRSVSEFFDSYSHDFNAIYGNENTFLNRIINQFFRKSMHLRYVKSLEGCDPIEGKTVLDVGCGPGHYGVALAAKGARRVLGIDFAEGMIELARKNAERAGVEDKCEFKVADFSTYPFQEAFDYSIVMGFMDYVAQPVPIIRRVLGLTRSKAFFSFPADGGLLAWQRKLRYKRRCDLFMYTRPQIESLFAAAGARDVKLERISRDFFATASGAAAASAP